MKGRLSLVVVVAVLTAMTQMFILPAEAVQFTNSARIGFHALGGAAGRVVATPTTCPPDQPNCAPAGPYPSNIDVSGLSGTVTDVNVILHGFDCSGAGPLEGQQAFPEDIDILLVGPSGANAVILSDVGGANQDRALQFTDITITLDDEALIPLPADTQFRLGRTVRSMTTTTPKKTSPLTPSPPPRPRPRATQRCPASTASTRTGPGACMWSTIGILPTTAASCAAGQ